VFPLQSQRLSYDLSLIANHFQSPLSYPPVTVSKQSLFAASSDLIALSGFHEGEIGYQLDRNIGDSARALAQEWKDAFGDRFYLSAGFPVERQMNCSAWKYERLSSELNIPTVITMLSNT